MIYSKEVLEQLLFPLNKVVYDRIDDTLREYLTTEEQKAIIETYKAENIVGFGKRIDKKALEGFKYLPILDLKLDYSDKDDINIRNIHKKKNFDLKPVKQEARLAHLAELPSSDLIISFWHKGIKNCFIVPIAFLLGFNQKKVSSPGYYQVYQHIIYPKKIIQRQNISIKEIRDNGYLYIGITKRTWQKRYAEHIHNAQNGSNLRFHRCLREEFFEIGAIEHILNHAGLTESEAMDIEENDVEYVALYPLHRLGLNMIPGGKAGLQFLHNYAKRTGYKIERKLNADIFEEELIKIQEHHLLTLQDTPTDCRGEKLAELWRSDINFRIRAITNQNRHLSYKQIQTARILNASGWESEKIFQNIQMMNPQRKINRQQLSSMLEGKTYSSLPDVLLDIDDTEITVEETPLNQPSATIISKLLDYLNSRFKFKKRER